MAKQHESLEVLLERYLQAHEREVTDEASANALIERFMAEHQEAIARGMTPKERRKKTADDYLEEAETLMRRGDLPGARRKLAAALRLEPENLDALGMLAMVKGERNANAALRALDEAIEIGRRQMRQGRHFEEDMGEFWYILETRPFMRLLDHRVRLLVQCGKLRLAVTQCEEMLRLCENDNLGARLTLRHLYAALEDEAALLALEERYPDEGTESLLPMAALRYKQGDEEEAAKLLRRLAALNPGLQPVVDAYLTDELPEEALGYYRADSEEQLLCMLDNYAFLYAEMQPFFDFIEDVMRDA